MFYDGHPPRTSHINAGSDRPVLSRRGLRKAEDDDDDAQEPSGGGGQRRRRGRRGRRYGVGEFWEEEDGGRFTAAARGNGKQLSMSPSGSGVEAGVTAVLIRSSRHPYGWMGERRRRR